MDDFLEYFFTAITYIFLGGLVLCATILMLKGLV